MIIGTEMEYRGPVLPLHEMEISAFSSLISRWSAGPTSECRYVVVAAAAAAAAAAVAAAALAGLAARCVPVCTKSQNLCARAAVSTSVPAAPLPPTGPSACKAAGQSASIPAVPNHACCLLCSCFLPLPDAC